MKSLLDVIRAIIFPWKTPKEVKIPWSVRLPAMGVIGLGILHVYIRDKRSVVFFLTYLVFHWSSAHWYLPIFFLLYFLFFESIQIQFVRLVSYFKVMIDLSDGKLSEFKWTEITLNDYIESDVQFQLFWRGAYLNIPMSNASRLTQDSEDYAGVRIAVLKHDDPNTVLGQIKSYSLYHEQLILLQDVPKPSKALDQFKILHELGHNSFTQQWNRTLYLSGLGSSILIFMIWLCFFGVIDIGFVILLTLLGILSLCRSILLIKTERLIQFENEIMADRFAILYLKDKSKAKLLSIMEKYPKFFYDNRFDDKLNEVRSQLLKAFCQWSLDDVREFGNKNTPTDYLQFYLVMIDYLRSFLIIILAVGITPSALGFSTSFHLISLILLLIFYIVVRLISWYLRIVLDVMLAGGRVNFS